MTYAPPVQTMIRCTFGRHVMENPAWSNNQLRKLGEHIRDDKPIPPELPSYDEVMLWFNDLAVHTQRKIRLLDWTPLLDHRIPDISSRPKTIDTLRQKLQRDRATPLPSIQDLAGVRFEAEMSLDEQDAVVFAIASLFDVPENKIKDMRRADHSGYRAVHIWVGLPDLGRIEIQVRTHLQGMWANVYEALADVIGRQIRYGLKPSDDVSRDLVEKLQDFSTSGIAVLEESRNDLARLELKAREHLRTRTVSDVDQRDLRLLSEAQSVVRRREVTLAATFAALEVTLRQIKAARKESAD
jgi:ppGpp synthetase/RelA/SpoT-type nucleotidyltranferase